MSEVKITCNDETKTYPKNTTYLEISKDFKLKHDTVCVIVNNRIASLADKAERDAEVKFLDITSQLGNRIYASGLKMIFEYAVYKNFPDMKVKFSFNLPKGIVAELDYDKYITNDHISKIRSSMASIVDKDKKIEKMIVKRNDAITFHDSKENMVKADNIRHITDTTVYLYRLENVVNYYYSEMPYSTGILNKYEVRYLGKNLVVINFPHDSDNGKIPDYVNYSGVIEEYTKGKKWLSTMRVPYINDINKEIYKGKISSFVKSSELNFNLEINETAKYVANHPNIKYVMISGPSTSGKTTVTKRLANYFEIYGLEPIVISSDDYFKERVDTPKDENGKYDFECLQALDLEYLNSDMKKLLDGEEITLPQFNFITGKKEISSRKIKLTENSIILFEGLHAINDELMPSLPNNMKYKIYVSPYMSLCLDEHNFIPNSDLRLIRRIVRDFLTRGYSAEKTIESNIKVREGEAKYITPYIHQADKIINTSLPYELGVLRIYVEPLLFSITNKSIFFNEARRLLRFLNQFFTISSEFVPKDSIIREFIGGDNID